MKNKKNVLLAGVVSLGMILAGCASGSSDSGTMYGEYVYPIQDVTMDVYGNNQLNTYSFQYIVKKHDGKGRTVKEIHKVEDYTNEEAGGMRDVKFAIDGAYGNKNCYVVDMQQNECLYLTKETYEKIRSDCLSRQ